MEKALYRARLVAFAHITKVVIRPRGGTRPPGRGLRACHHSGSREPEINGSAFAVGKFRQGAHAGSGGPPRSVRSPPARTGAGSARRPRNTESPPRLAPGSARGVTASSDGPNRNPTWSIRGVRRTMPQARDRRAQYRMYGKQRS